MRVALTRAFERRESTLSTVMFVQFNGAPRRVYLQVKPVMLRERERTAERALIFFIEAGPEDHVSPEIRQPDAGEDVLRLQH